MSDNNHYDRLGRDTGGTKLTWIGVRNGRPLSRRKQVLERLFVLLECTEKNVGPDAGEAGQYGTVGMANAADDKLTFQALS